jgi:hypothetical protein
LSKWLCYFKCSLLRSKYSVRRQTLVNNQAELSASQVHGYPPHGPPPAPNTFHVDLPNKNAVNLHHSQSLSRKSHLTYVNNADGAWARLNAIQSTRLGRPESGSVSVFAKYSTAADGSRLLQPHRVCTEFLLNLL